MFDEFIRLWEPVLTLYTILFRFAPFWGPILLGAVAWELWHAYRQDEYVKKTFIPKLLEIRLPKEIEKLPNAMELVYESMVQSSTGTWFDKLWGGRVLPEFSFELVSTEGVIHFYLRLPEKTRIPIVSAIYAQYPNVEITEVEDYVYKIPYTKNSEEWSLWGTEYKLTKEDAYPIKTYVDFKLNEIQMKEEQKADPLATVIELLSAVPPKCHVWIQILFQAATERHTVRPKTSWQSFFWTFFPKRQDWKGQGKELIAKIQKKGEEEKLSKQEVDQIAAIQRSISKRGFDVGIRSIQVAKKEAFQGSICGGLYLLFQAFASGDFNTLKGTRATDFDYPWQDWNGIRLRKMKWEMFDAYIRRSYFRSPYKKKPFVLNTEEMATIFHFPGGVSQAPTLARIESRKVEPPANLPI